MKSPVFILAQATPGTNSPPGITDKAAEGSSTIDAFSGYSALSLLLEGRVFIGPIYLMALMAWRLSSSVGTEKVIPNTAHVIGYEYE